jgi:CheY-like chemotaxis protein
MKTGKQVRILIVEDDLLIALCMVAELKAAGCIVCGQVTTGESAMEAAAQEKPDIILMDIRLAGKMDGIEAAEHIRKFSLVPIIFATGYEDPDTEERSKKVAPLAFLTKPVSMSTLLGYMNSIQ